MTFDPPTAGPVWLASRSPRRRLMLHEAGVPITIHPSGIDDGALRRGRVTPAQWVMALAYLKGRAAADDLRAGEPARHGTVLAADTLCVRGEMILGQPRTEAEAAAMLHALVAARHETMTGVCLIALPRGTRWMMVDRTEVRWGAVGAARIDDYLASGEWRGKAGGYNLEDRLRAGWPIEWTGDPATVMGLPLRRLEPWLDRVRGVRT